MKARAVGPAPRGVMPSPQDMDLAVVVHVTSSAAYARLARSAQRAGVTSVHAFLQLVIDQEGAVHTDRDVVEDLHSRDMRNTEICERTGLTRLDVQHHLQALGLRANRPDRRRDR